MPQINQLSAADSLTDGDLVPIYKSSAGDARKIAASTMKTYFQAGIAVTDDKITQYASPSATGFSVQVNDDSNSVWLVLTPTAGFAAGTIVMPAVANAIEGQEVLVNCTQAVTTLTVSGNGATVTGSPTTLAANGFFRLRFEPVSDVWYRVG